MKLKAKVKGNVIAAKALLKHDNLTYDQAKKKGTEANFITHITAKANGKVVYEASTSQFFSKNPMIKFKFKSSVAKAGDEIELSWIDLKGNKKSKKAKIK